MGKGTGSIGKEFTTPVGFTAITFAVTVRPLSVSTVGFTMTVSRAVLSEVLCSVTLDFEIVTNELGAVTLSLGTVTVDFETATNDFEGDVLKFETGSSARLEWFEMH